MHAHLTATITGQIVCWGKIAHTYEIHAHTHTLSHTHTHTEREREREAILYYSRQYCVYNKNKYMHNYDF